LLRATGADHVSAPAVVLGVVIAVGLVVLAVVLYRMAPP
jgi:hypothetical protein